jgi:peroxiredoxin
MTAVNPARIAFIAAAAALALGVPASAQNTETSDDSMAHEAMTEPAPFGPSIGQNIADVIVAPDSTGATRTFADLTGEKGLVLNFNRSVDWCPFCKAQTLAVDAGFSEFADRGYNVVVLTTDTPETLARYVAERHPSLTLISDADSTIISALGLLDPEYPEGNRRHGLPYPETLILSPEGVVEARLALDDLYGQDGAFQQRVDVNDVLAAIDGLHPAM